MERYKKHYKKGFTLIESLVVVFIIAVAILTFYKTFTLAMRYAVDTKGRTASVELASARMEILRNTPYEDIILDPGTNPPTGNAVASSSGTGLLYDETMMINDVTHRVFTEIYYVDDDVDNAGGDAVPQDYKKIIVTVAWGVGVTDDTDTSHRISLTSFFVPPSGNEGAVENGVLSINVVSSDGSPVEGASVSVDDVNGSTDPDYSVSELTDSGGNVLYENVPASMNMYRIVVTKSGYEDISTMASYPSTAYYPLYVDASILPGTITTVTIVEDAVMDATMVSQDPFGHVIQDINFNMTGGRILGLDTDGESVYINTDITSTTDSNGESVLQDISGCMDSIGRYNFIVNTSGYLLWKVTPSADTVQGAADIDATVADVDMILVDENYDGLFVEVVDAETGNPLSEVDVHVENTLLDYDVMLTTDIYGLVYFPENDTDVLVNGETYTVTASLSDYNDSTTTITVDGLTQETFTLSAI